jgi:hypothetical protein
VVGLPAQSRVEPRGIVRTLWHVSVFLLLGAGFIARKWMETLKAREDYAGVGIETLTILKDLDSWIRRRLRCFMVKRWINNCHTRYRNLVRLGVNGLQARVAAASHKGPWVMSNMKPLKIAMSNRFFTEHWFRGLFDQYRALGKAT